jgi:hypothetical protein
MHSLEYHTKKTSMLHTTDEMILISFDMGAKNFACFAIRFPDDQKVNTYAQARALSVSPGAEILHWSNTALDIKGSGIDSMVAGVAAHAHRQWAIYSMADYVVIEQQVLRNPRMKCAAHALQGIFAFHGIRVHMMPALQKFRAFGTVDKIKGSGELKKRAVTLMTAWINDFEGVTSPGASESRTAALTGAGKRDDLADAALQGVSAMFMATRGM